jgi:hypothetical protein
MCFRWAALVATSLMPSVKWRAYGRTAGASAGEFQQRC